MKMQAVGAGGGGGETAHAAPNLILCFAKSLSYNPQDSAISLKQFNL
jgi:hypothetical protein